MNSNYPLKNILTGYIRDPTKVKNNLTALETGELITSKECKIHIPSRYIERDLALVGIDTYIYGVYALIYEEEYYSVFSINGIVQIDPYKIIKEKVDGVEYTALYFEANSVLIKNLNIVQRDTLVNKLLDEFIFQSKIPWYLNYNDLGKLFDTAKQYANSNISQRYEVMELLVSLISRNSNEMQNYYRTFITEPDQVFTNPPNYVPLNSVYYSASNTLNKLAGNYMSKGLVSALVSKTENVERIESLLKQ